jgi:hypothetical protein
MTDQNRELSDLKLERKECPKCGATWINGQHIWGGTGNTGNEDDLAGLVCNNLGDHQCINPKRGSDKGDSWASRLAYMEGRFDEKRADMEKLRDIGKSLDDL